MDRIGEFVTISGTTKNFREPARPRTPYSFTLVDKTGANIRVCAWPEIMVEITRWQEMATTGTPLRLTAQVAEYDNKLELHIQDWEEVHVGKRSEHSTATQSLAVNTTGTEGGR